jgi:hypothetical protein
MGRQQNRLEKVTQEAQKPIVWLCCRTNIEKSRTYSNIPQVPTIRMRKLSLKRN